MNDTSFHSSGYHKYFEGYTERKVKDQHGRHIERIYTAEYIQSSLSDSQLRLRKILYVALSLLSIGLWAAVSVSSTPSNFVRYVAIFSAISIFPLFFTFFFLIHFCVAPRKMTLNQYREASTDLQRASAVSAVFLLCAGIADIVFLIRNRYDFPVAEIPTLLCYLAASALLFVLFYLEYEADYIHIPNENSALAEQDDASEINW